MVPGGRAVLEEIGIREIGIGRIAMGIIGRPCALHFTHKFTPVLDQGQVQALIYFSSCLKLSCSSLSGQREGSLYLRGCTLVAALSQVIDVVLLCFPDSACN